MCLLFSEDPRRCEKRPISKVENTEYDDNHSIDDQMTTKAKTPERVKDDDANQAATTPVRELNDQSTSNSSQNQDVSKTVKKESEDSSQAVKDEVPGKTVVTGSISKTGNWIEAKDPQGNIYYYHRVTRYHFRVYEFLTMIFNIRILFYFIFMENTSCLYFFWFLYEKKCTN